MIQNSTHHNPMLTGSSTHNQRIERLWRDVFRCVLTVYYQLFYHLEGCGKLDSLSDVDIYCLHLVYLPKINQSLTAFVDGWNSHALISEHNLTPLQLFSAGSMLSRSQSQPHVLGDGMYDDGLATDMVSLRVEIPPIDISLSAEKHTQLSVVLQTATSSSNFSIDVYDTVRHFVYDNIET